MDSFAEKAGDLTEWFEQKVTTIFIMIYSV